MIRVWWFVVRYLMPDFVNLSKAKVLVGGLFLLQAVLKNSAYVKRGLVAKLRVLRTNLFFIFGEVFGSVQYIVKTNRSLRGFVALAK